MLLRQTFGAPEGLCLIIIHIGVRIRTPCSVCEQDHPVRSMKRICFERHKTRDCNTVARLPRSVQVEVQLLHSPLVIGNRLDVAGRSRSMKSVFIGSGSVSSGSMSSSLMKQFAQFGLDTRNECLWRESTQLALPPKPFAVLRYLVENPGRLVTHDELLDALWPETYVQPQVLRTYVLELRKILGDNPAQPEFIQTLPKRGYCFIAPVSDWSGPEPSMERVAKSAGVPQAGTILAAKAPSVTTLVATGQSSSTTNDVQAPGEIVGRDGELGTLRKAFELAGGGQRQVVFIQGEVGIGKTALVDAFADWIAASSSAVVARGQCVEGFGGKEEYYPVMEILSQLCASADGGRACETLAALAPAWLASHVAENAKALAQLPQADGRALQQERMPGDICAALEELDSEVPLVLIFEDLHSADASTIHLISALARRRKAAKLTIIVSLRPHNAQADHPLKGVIQDLRMKRLCSEIEMAPLRRGAVKTLVARELKQDEPPVGLTEFVHRHSEGNPLFAIAIVEHLITQRFLVLEKQNNNGQEERTWVQRFTFVEMEAGVPDGLARMIELELERLTAQEQSILEAGSLTAVVFPAWAVAAALNLDCGEVEEICDALARKLYFMERAGQDELPGGLCSTFYVFSHGIYREVLYGRQSAQRRSRRHIRIAEKLSEIFEGREASVARDIAMHYEAAGDLERAVLSLREASLSAERRHAFAEATELLERALRIAEHRSSHASDSDLLADLDGMRSDLAKLYATPAASSAMA
jgi:DNA-binding winged helix-turn-helix (wHTH) protein